MRTLLEFAVEIAREAGELTLGYFSPEGIAAESKSDGSPVTEADREAERLLRRRIEAAWPEDGILGEEFGERPGTSGRRWIVDPVDGTRSFSRGVPLYGTLVGVEIEGRADVGVICMPAIGEIAFAARGEGAFWTIHAGTARETTRPARVSTTARLDDALLCFTSLGAYGEGAREGPLARALSRVRRHRGWSDCYAHLLVATGRAEAALDAPMNIWDCAALQPVVEEAGGVFTNLAGEVTHDGGSAVSTNAALAAEFR